MTMTKRKGYAAVNEAFDAAKKGNTLLRKMIKESADMADTEARCEPPPELRERDGWHWVETPAKTRHIARWFSAHKPDIEPLWVSEHLAHATTGWAAKEWGWRYIAPVATPAEVDALRAEADEWKRLCTIAEPGVAALRAELQRCEAACFDVQRDNIALRARVAELEAALKDITSLGGCGFSVTTARAALEHKP